MVLKSLLFTHTQFTLQSWYLIHIPGSSDIFMVGKIGKSITLKLILCNFKLKKNAIGAINYLISSLKAFVCFIYSQLRLKLL